jgi:hypothetical protein
LRPEDLGDGKGDDRAATVRLVERLVVDLEHLVQICHGQHDRGHDERPAALCCLQEDLSGERPASDSDRDIGGHVGACVVIGEQPEQHLLADCGVRRLAADSFQPLDSEVVEAWLQERVEDQPSVQATA